MSSVFFLFYLFFLPGSVKKLLRKCPQTENKKPFLEKEGEAKRKKGTEEIGVLKGEGGGRGRRGEAMRGGG